MDKKILAVGVVIVLLVAGVAAFFVLKDDGEDLGNPTEFDDAGLKVYGNINGDWYLDSKDAKLIQQLIDDGKTAADYPMADANQDKVLDSKDVEVVNNVVDRKATVLYHINYHDTDSDGVADQELVSSKFPVESVIISGSANVAISLFTLGIIDQVKGAAYSSTSMDKDLYKESYLDTNKVEFLNKSAGKIPFEDGKAGASDVIQRENVTALITDWNKTYITNEADFEKSNIDVIRISGAATADADMIHTTMMLGLMFDCIDRATDYCQKILDVVSYVDGAVKNTEMKKSVASSMNKYVSSEDSDYTKSLVRAGSEYGLKGVDFGGKTSIKVTDHPEVYMEDFDYICHIRTNVGYNPDIDLKNTWEEYTSGFSDWEHSETGQFMVSGVIPMSLRIAYSAAFMHDEVSIDKVDEMHQQIVDQFYNGKQYKVADMHFLLTAEDVKAM